MDRRKRKSRQAILTACIDLSKEKEFQHVTIHEIVEKADLNRGTFYLHFVDKVDMMKSFESEMLSKIEHVLVSNFPADFSFEAFVQSRYETIVQILTCYEENKELLSFILSAGNTSAFQEQLGNIIKQFLHDIILPKIKTEDVKIPLELVSMIFTSLSLTLAQYAYKTEEPLDIKAHAEFLLNIMLHGPMKMFGLAPK